MSATKQVKFLIISDTHEYDFTSVTSPSKHGFRGDAIPQCDVVLHCGDLTHDGKLFSHGIVMKQLATIDAELKLVIAGNHDVSLDRDEWVRLGGAPVMHDAAVGVWTGDVAKAAGIEYLEEGTHTFTLKSGATFTVYASPWTPKFGESAFQYKSNEDRFNLVSPPGFPNVSTSSSRVPRDTKVDIMMTHGPPKYILDSTEEGPRGVNAGCEHLLRAVCRARPRLHCFGHVHTGWGAEKVTWDTSVQMKAGKEDACWQTSDKARVFALQNSIRNKGHAPVDTKGMVQGEQTLFVNAAIEAEEWTNAPWFVTMELPVKKQMVSSMEQGVVEVMEIDSLAGTCASLKRQAVGEKSGEDSTSVAKKVKCCP